MSNSIHKASQMFVSINTHQNENGMCHRQFSLTMLSVFCGLIFCFFLIDHGNLISAHEPELISNNNPEVDSEFEISEPVNEKRNNKNNPSTQTVKAKPEKKKTLIDLKPEGIVDPDLLKEVISKLDLIDKNLSTFDDVPFIAAERNGKLQLLIDTPGVQLLHYGNNQISRILGFYLVIANLKDQPEEFPITKLQLSESGKEIGISELPSSVKQYSIVMGDRGESLKNFDHNAILKIPPKGVARGFVVFHGLDQGNHIPKLTLSYTQDGQKQEIDINRRELGLLKLSKKRIGPDNCLLHLTISGQSNMINSGCLIEELDAASTTGVSRAVIEWNADAVKFDSQCENWYRQALEQHYSPNNWFNDQYPSFPSNIQELHLAFTSNDQFFVNFGQNSFSGRATIYVHKSSLEACSSALRTAVEILNHDKLVAMLESGEPASIVSVLAFAANKLTIEDLDLVLPLIKKQDKSIVSTALSALRYIDHPDALSTLLTAVADPDIDIANIAIQSLSNSKIILYQDELLKLYEHSELPVQQKIVRLISTDPHPKWLPILREQYAKGPIELRVEALKAIGQINPVDLPDLLSKAINDSDQKIWDTALGLIIKSPEQLAESSILDVIYNQLEKNAVTVNMLSFISQTQDPKAQQLLFNHWKNNRGKANARVLSELLNMLDPLILKEITDRYDSLTEQEKSNYIKNYPLNNGDYQAYLTKWKEALFSENNSLNNASQEVYRKNADDQMLNIIIEGLNLEVGEKPNNNRVSKFCNMLYQYGTIEARQALRNYRNVTTNEQSINYAENALRNLYQKTPCYYFIYNARNQNDNGKYSSAIKLLDISIKVDPDIPDFYLERARSRVGLDSFDQAIEDYRKVIEIDPKHRTVWPLLADAYIEQRDFKKAVETLNEAILIYPKDVSLWNSRGHAYAMMENFDASLTNYLKASELDPKNSLAITGVALAETYLGKFEAGVDRIRKAQKNYANDNLFAYNSACVYSRALEQLLKIPSPSPQQQQLIVEYRLEGLKELKNSINLGFVNDDWIKQDPDLVTLAKNDNLEFKDLLKLAVEKRAELKLKKQTE